MKKVHFLTWCLLGLFLVTLQVNNAHASELDSLANHLEIPSSDNGIEPSTCPTILIIPNPSICGMSDGSIDLDVTPPEMYTYMWSTGATTQNLTNVPAGTYTVTVTDSEGCTGTAYATVMNWTSGFSISGDVTNPTAGQNNGAIDLSVTPAGSYTYTWSNGATTQDLSNLGIGTYYVTTTNSFGCTETASFTLTSVCDLSVTYTMTPFPFCAGDLVTMTLNHTGGTGPYSYEWTNGSTTQSITFVAQGVITLDGSVIDANDCVSTVYIHLKSPIWQVFIQAYPANCGQSNGIVDLTVVPGTGNFTYSWSNGETTQDLLAAPAGTYTVTVTGDNTCTATASATVTNTNSSITVTGATTPNTSCTTPNGAINITVNPAGSYTYAWSNGSSSEDLTDLSAGIYTVSVSGGGNCTAISSFTVTSTLQPPSLSTSTSAATCGQSNGTVNLTVTPAGSHTYLWSNGQTTEDLANLAPGPYMVTVTSANGCTASTSATVANNNTGLNITGSTTPNTACNTPNGAIDISVNPTGSYTYAWSNGFSTEDLTGLSAGIYTVTVTAGGNCSASASFTVSNSLQTPTLSTSATPATCGQSNGAVNLTVLPAGAYTFIWSNSEITEDLTNVAAGTYTVTVTGTNGCTASTSATVANNNTGLNITGTTTPNTACNTPNGAIDISVNPTGSYTYAWSNGFSTEDLTGLSAGIYTVTVTAGGNCSASASFTVSNSLQTPTLSTTTTPATCGQSNGAINLTVTPAGTYTFIWSNSEITEDLTNVASGIYSVTVTGANGCTASTSATVANNNTGLNITGLPTPNTACNTPNGAINISINPTGSHTYAWSNGFSTEDLTGLTAGIYTVTVTAGGNCSASATFSVIDNFQAPNPGTTTTAATCGQSNGAVDLTVTPAGAYTFIWSNSEITEDLPNVAAGIYTVTVTGANGCTATSSATVANNNTGLNITGSTTPNTACNTPNGAIDISVNPTGSYTYTWSNGFSSEDLTGLSAGIYTVTVTAGGNCSVSATFSVIDNFQVPNPGTTTTAATCGQSNGAVDLTVTPAGAYTFIWSNSEITEDLPNVAAGIYTVTVTGANGCTATSSATVANNNTGLNITGSTTPNTACNTPNGAIDISVNPTGSYTYAWLNGFSTEDLTGLTAGIYTVTVTAGGNCSASATFSVIDNFQVPNPGTTTTAATCGQSNGAVNLTVTPAGAYTFIWSNSEIIEDLTNVAAGTYSVTVTGANGCTASTSATVANNNTGLNITGSTTPNTACNTPNGAIDISVNPTGSYTYTWSNGFSSEDLTGLSAGIYTVTVTAGGNCSASATFSVIDNFQVLNPGTTTTAATCGQSNGAVDLTVTPAGAYTFIWSNSEITEDLTNVAAGIYTVTVTGANGCTASSSATVANNNTGLNITGTTTPNSACNTPNGAINISVNPTGSYTYAWSNGFVTEDLTGLSAGIYTVTVTGGGNCSASASFTVSNSLLTPNLSTSVTPATCGQSNGAVNLTVTPAGTYTFIWSNSEITEDLTNVAAGTYSVTVTGANGCTASTSATVANNNTGLNITGTTTPNSACNTPNGAIDISVNPTGSHTYAWSNGFSSEDLTGLTAGIYTVTATAGGNCSASATFSVIDNFQAPNPGTTTTAATCGQSNGAVDLTVTPAGAYTFIWSNSEITEDLTNVAAGIYTVTVTGANGCTASTSATVANNNTGLNITGLPTPNTACNTPNGAIDISVNPTGPYTYTWSNGFSTEDLNGLSAGTYAVTITAGGNCSASATYTIADNFQVPIPSATTLPATCGQSNGSVNLTVTPTGTYTFSWSTGETTEDLINIAAGTYTITITSPGNCTQTASFSIAGPALPVVAISGPTSKCENEVVTLSASTGHASYLWSNGTTTGNITISQPGTYSVTITDLNNCTATDEWNISALPTDHIFLETVTCSIQDTGAVTLPLTNRFGCDSIIVTHTTFNAFEYQLSATQSCWNAANGSLRVDLINGNVPCRYALDGGIFQTTLEFSGLGAGPHTMTGMDANGCTLEKAIEIPLTVPTEILVYDDTLNCDKTRTVLHPTVVSGNPATLTWSWPDGSNLPWMAVENAGTYVVRVQDGCEEVEHAMEVRWAQENPGQDMFFVPNCFSPNDDGQNDVVQVFINENYEIVSFEFSIFDRWGNEMFRTKNTEQGWNGIFQGIDMKPAVFVWYLKAQVRFCNGRLSDVFRKGDVTIVR
jgi:gliding motility-associated-like protein